MSDLYKELALSLDEISFYADAERQYVVHREDAKECVREAISKAVEDWEYEYNVKVIDDDGDWWLYSDSWYPNLEDARKFMSDLGQTEFWVTQDMSVVKRRKVGEVEDV